ncbi:MAG: hypothetical protein AB1390_10480 [Nitrospirota bacterium]
MRLQNSVLLAFLIIFLSSLVSASYSHEMCTEIYGNGTRIFSLATGSPGELGILRALGENFTQEMDDD